MEKIRIKQVRSEIGRNPKIRATLQALGLKGVGKAREVEVTPVVKGMIKRVEYLLEVSAVK